MKMLGVLLCVLLAAGIWHVAASSGASSSASSLKAQGVMIVRTLLPCAQAMGRHQSVPMSSVAALGADGSRLLGACDGPWRTLGRVSVLAPLRPSQRAARGAVHAALAVASDDLDAIQQLQFPQTAYTVLPVMKMVVDERAFLAHAMAAFEDVKRVSG